MKSRTENHPLDEYLKHNLYRYAFGPLWADNRSGLSALTHLLSEKRHGYGKQCLCSDCRPHVYRLSSKGSEWGKLKERLRNPSIATVQFWSEDYGKYKDASE